MLTPERCIQIKSTPVNIVLLVL